MNQLSRMSALPWGHMLGDGSSTGHREESFQGAAVLIVDFTMVTYCDRGSVNSASVAREGELRRGSCSLVLLISVSCPCFPCIARKSLEGHCNSASHIFLMVLYGYRTVILNLWVATLLRDEPPFCRSCISDILHMRYLHYDSTQWQNQVMK